MTTCTVPHPFDKDDLLTDAYERGWRWGADFAAYNVPKPGDMYEGEPVTAENASDAHLAACWEAESNARSYSPFEFTASEFNASEYADDLWEAFEAGTAARIGRDAAATDYSEFDEEDESDDA